MKIICLRKNILFDILKPQTASYLSHPPFVRAKFQNLRSSWQIGGNDIKTDHVGSQSSIS